MPEPDTAYPQSHDINPSHKSEPLRVTVPCPDIFAPHNGQGVTVYVISAYIVISTSNISINRTGRSHRRLFQPLEASEIEAASAAVFYYPRFRLFAFRSGLNDKLASSAFMFFVPQNLIRVGALVAKIGIKLHHLCSATRHIWLVFNILHVMSFQPLTLVQLGRAKRPPVISFSLCASLVSLLG